MTFEPYSFLMIASIMLALVLSGSVKGVFGIGFPVVAMAILPLFITPISAITVIALPIVVTNIQQLFSEKEWRHIIIKYRYMALFMLLASFLSSQILTQISVDLITAIIGFALALFAIYSLFNFTLPITTHSVWQIIAGASSGLLSGMTGIQSTAIIYFASLDISRNEFVGAVGYIFLVGGLGLSIGLINNNLLNSSTVILSLFGVLFSVVGFKLGSLLRPYIHSELFKKLLFLLMLIIGMKQIYQFFANSI
ncbi:MAG: sulfite exporter TauE/SafE family protein [Alphaproteobacteria bacterium]|nr:sulfite exporter TauE/SafE family protein [Alphaproteobacteria bacterium]